MGTNLKEFISENWPAGLAVFSYGFIFATVKMGKALWLVIGLAIAVFLAIVIWQIREIRFARYLKSRINETNYEYLEIAALAVEEVSALDIDGYTLIPPYNNKYLNQVIKIYLRPTVNHHPWEEKILSFQFGRKIENFTFQIRPGSPHEENILHRVIRTPNVKSRKGKISNRYDWDWLFKNSKSLRDYFNHTFSGNPEKAFRYLLYSEGCFQTRTGTKPIWVQNPEYKKCQLCDKSMNLITQIASHEFGFQDFTIYLFGCHDHPNERDVIWQRT